MSKRYALWAAKRPKERQAVAPYEFAVIVHDDLNVEAIAEQLNLSAGSSEGLGHYRVQRRVIYCGSITTAFAFAAGGDGEVHKNPTGLGIVSHQD